MRMLWVWGVFKCSLELVALLGGVVALQMPQTLLFQQVFEAARDFFSSCLSQELDSRDCVVWLALAIRARVVVVVATPLIPVVVVAARVCLLLPRMESYLAFALSSLSAHYLIMSLSLVIELGWR
jgi:hypothetical protein